MRLEDWAGYKKEERLWTAHIRYFISQCCFPFFFHWDAVWTGTGTTFNIGGAMGAPNISNHHAKATRRNMPAEHPGHHHELSTRPT